jgi:hypothetical protein
LSQTHCCSLVINPCSQLTQFPKLRELDDNVTGDPEYVGRCFFLESLILRHCSFQMARAVVTLTSLTSLRIGPVVWHWPFYRPDHLRLWLEHATALKKLKDLHICISHRALPLFSNLTGLTGLTWLDDDRAVNDESQETLGVAPLTCLGQLRSLELQGRLSERDLSIACCLGAGSLVSLKLWDGSHASPDTARLLTRQTALTELAVGGQQLANMQHFTALRLELVQSLHLVGLESPDAEGLLALGWATRLTELCIDTHRHRPHMGLSEALGRLDGLRSLTLTGVRRGPALHFAIALPPSLALQS